VNIMNTKRLGDKKVAPNAGTWCGGGGGGAPRSLSSYVWRERILRIANANAGRRGHGQVSIKRFPREDEIHSPFMIKLTCTAANLKCNIHTYILEKTRERARECRPGHKRKVGQCSRGKLCFIKSANFATDAFWCLRSMLMRPDSREGQEAGE
jgi:hypothetical protein